MSVDADWRSAGWAFNAGLYAATAPTVAEMDAVLERRATWLSQANPGAMLELKRVFWEETEHWDDLLRARAGMSGRLVLSPAAKAAIAAAGRR